MPSDDTVISVKNLTKKYRIFGHPGDRIKQALTFGRVRFHREFTALQDVSFEIKKGETVGIIGRNGSGKSTLLQLICGILKPTSGTVRVNGRVSALLELGAGFNPEFTGRENVYFQGALMGFSKAQMDERFDAIAAFADIGEFIDQPVRTYSSGMFVRLAFSVAVGMEPDILVVDEALAVGDARFQKRCHSKLRMLEQSGVTLIFVSHDYELINTLTKKALLLESGRVLYWGRSRDATHFYRKIVFEEESRLLTGTISQDSQCVSPQDGEEMHEYGTGGATISSVRILDEDGIQKDSFASGERIRIDIAIQVEKSLDHLNVGVVIRTLQGAKIYSWGTLNHDMTAESGDSFWVRSFSPGDEFLVTLLLQGNLGLGRYEVQAVVSQELEPNYTKQIILHWRDEMGFFRVSSHPPSGFFGGICNLHGKAYINDQYLSHEELSEG